MTKQIGIKLEPETFDQFKAFAKEYGTTVSSLVRQATIEFIKRRISGVNSSSQQEDGGVK